MRASRRGRGVRIWALRLTLLALGLLTAFTANAPAADPPPAQNATQLSDAERKKLLAERDRFSKESQDLQSQGKLTDAIASAEKKLGAERRLFRATPLYVLNRMDPVLFIVGVPEADSAYVTAGSKAHVRVPALGREFPAQVTRISWALNSTSRTLTAEIDLPNPKGVFLPGMYAYGAVLIERHDVRALPVSTITQIGNQTCCYLVVGGKAVRTPVQTGVRDGSWVEVTGKLVRSAGSADGTWEAFDGTEAVVDGDLSEVSDGALVTVNPPN